MDNKSLKVLERLLVRERGYLPGEVWEHARRRAEIIGPLAELEVVGHQAADTAAQALGLSRRQVSL